jgi:CheY-like chemotaxis protein
MVVSDSPKKQRIIIVEDNALVAKFFSMALERGGGYSCLVTEDVPAILEEVQAGLVDLVLLDVSLTSAEWEGRSGWHRTLPHFKTALTATPPGFTRYRTRHERRSRTLPGKFRRRRLLGKAGLRFRRSYSKGARSHQPLKQIISASSVTRLNLISKRVWLAELLVAVPVFVD